ncbi:ribosome-associated translation inhibitor RaiA [Pedobacter sp. UYP30]|uniref:HPF/RaiA family ribosome-associated protein n=1 Tax=Pedobacter sp. UYP30 TaxID=1756400 RepID=UPI003395DEFB
MTIQLNADKNLTIHSDYEAQMSEKLENELKRFSEHITRLEVHLSDENGSKEGQEDKKCLIECRVEGKQPMAATDFGNSYDQALNGAVGKLKNALTTMIGKLKEH